MLPPTLGDLGEREIVESILRPRYSAPNFRFGDDCASLRIPSAAGWLVTTTDPCPEPAAGLVGYSDLYFRGWLLAAINLSDLAAAGAEPIGLLTSLVLPATLPVDDFVRLLDGIDDCCAGAGAPVIGGNLKEGPRYELTATAVGVCDTPPLSRSGAVVNDLVLLVGDLGSFWAGYFAITRDLVIPPIDRDVIIQNVLCPKPKVAAGVALRRAGLLSACMDNSDGLYPSLSVLARTNGLGVRLDFAEATFSPAVQTVASLLDADPVRFALGWGDWQLLCTAPAEHLSAIRALCAGLGVLVTCIGSMVAGAGVQILHRGENGRLAPLDSQRFARDSWFTTGVETYAELLLTGAIVDSGKVLEE